MREHNGKFGEVEIRAHSHRAIARCDVPESPWECHPPKGDGVPTRTESRFGARTRKAFNVWWPSTR